MHLPKQKTLIDVMEITTPKSPVISENNNLESQTMSHVPELQDKSREQYRKKNLERALLQFKQT